MAPIIYTTPRSTETATGITAIDIVRGGGPIACFLWVMLSPHFKYYRVARGPAEVALFTFIAVALASCLWADASPLSTLLKALQLLFMYLCVAKVVATYDTYSEVIRAALHLTHLTLIAVLSQFLLFPGLTYTTAEGDPIPRLNSVAPSISANILGLVLGAGILSILLRVGPQWAVQTWIRLPLALSYVGMLLATRSRIITVAIALVCIACAGPVAARSWRNFTATIFTLAAAVITLPTVFATSTAQTAVTDFLTRGQDSSGLTTLTGRTVTWDAALEFWQEHLWLGGGYYTGHRLALVDFDSRFRNYSNIDSTWIETLVDVGIVGFIPLAAFVVLGFGQLAHVETDKYTRAFALAIWTTVVAISLVNPTLQSTWFTSILGGAVVLGATHHPTPFPARQVARAHNGRAPRRASRP